MDHNELKEKIIEQYKKLGFSIDESSKLSKYIRYLDIPNEFFRKQYQLFHAELIVSLYEIKKSDSISFDRYIKKLSDAESIDSFWGEKFEVLIHYKLLEIKRNGLIKNLKRGKDGKEPDLMFEFEDESVGIELTTLKFRNLLTKPEFVFNKIIDKLNEKNSKAYANENIALIIDVTNLEFIQNLVENGALTQLFKNYEQEILSKIRTYNFGFILMTENVFKTTQNGKLNKSINPIIGIANENEKGENIIKFLRIVFNNFEKDNDRLYHHILL